MSVKVKVLNGTEAPAPVAVPNPTKVAKVLSSAYVRKLNLGISYRIQQRELSHANSADLAAKARFR